ncbi:MAG: hypothetical protein H6719_24260 [Sandaracinaceae bacterium]|nr:hypothetical protein [Sandaracinaceae bacterium]
MVWIIIGRGTKTEPVEGGLSLERECPSCAQVSRFRERKAVKTFRLYMLDVFDYDEQRVMACGACGTLYATDELGRPSHETASGWRGALADAAAQVTDAVGKAGVALGPAAQKAGEALGPAWERASENARDLFGEAREGIAPLAKKASESVGDALRRLRAEVGDHDDDEDRDDDADVPESARETDPEKAAVLRRFEELERKMKKD